MIDVTSYLITMVYANVTHGDQYPLINKKKKKKKKFKKIQKNST